LIARSLSPGGGVVVPSSEQRRGREVQFIGSGCGNALARKP
jgi:hypothetical protein